MWPFRLCYHCSPGAVAALFARALGTGAASTVPKIAFMEQPEPPDGTGRLRVVSWNVAAVNNNPFEYWITHPSPQYRELMEAVESFILSPGADDVRIDEVFRPDMFDRVMGRMEEVGMGELDQVREMWNADYSSRRIVSGFLRDADIGKKRLISMPDRVTNTIQLASGDAAYRPAVSNCYAESLDSLEDWFEKWMRYMFDTDVDLDGKGGKKVYTLLQKIKKSKYPAVSELEEALSLPLQLVMLGVFDAILVNFMLSKAGSFWQGLRRDICSSLNSRKNAKILEILHSTYAEADVILLQEAGNQLVDLLRPSYEQTHQLVLPKSYNHKRGQNSIMLLRKGLVTDVKEVDIPPDGWDAGDLLTVGASLAGARVAFASFHGDTNGLLTAPALRRVVEYVPLGGLVFGMDANTYERESPSTFHVLEYEREFKSLGLSSCWPNIDGSRYTTFNARTYLQPQLNKASKSDELSEKGDRNPKDFVLFTNEFESTGAWRDNTGRLEYVENMVFPTLDFPSDHAVLSTELHFKVSQPAQDEL